jgi:Flp pilus assembly protein TadD
MAETETDPPSSRDIAGEDFLFHLYRGSELLQDNRVHEAKQELEQALGLQPLDPKGQDLLAIVYFRLGLYPRAIAIYRALIASYPDATTPRINLALCYLKTGQPGSARLELEYVIERDPSHARAWGYLGLAFQRLGDIERAISAFQAGGHHAMAKRLAEPGAAAPRGLSSPEREAVSRAMSAAFDELDHRDFRADTGVDRLSSSGTWAAVEPGRDAPPDRRSYYPPASLSATVLPSHSLPPQAPLPPPADPSVRGTSERPALVPPTVPPAQWAPPPSVDRFGRDCLLVFPRDHAAALHASGVVLLRPSGPIAVRLDVIRSITAAGPISTKVVNRRSHGVEIDEPLGGAHSPLYELKGAAQLVLGPPSGARLVPLGSTDEGLCVRESTLVAMDESVTFEGGRFAGADGDPVAVVHVRGPGSVTLALPIQHASIEVAGGREVLVRAHAVLGWAGRVTLRALPPSEAPAKLRGLLAVRGDGMVLVDGR